MHRLQVAVWCNLWGEGIIGPYFFETDGGTIITINGDAYPMETTTMITEVFLPALHSIDVNHVWFQQDSAICHTSYAIINLFRPTFDGPLINRNGDVKWPPRSCDLTPLNYFLRCRSRKVLCRQSRENLAFVAQHS